MSQCKGGCGFFGNPATQDYCSKCHRIARTIDPNTTDQEIRQVLRQTEQAAAELMIRETNERAATFMARFMLEKNVDLDRANATIAWLKQPENKASITSPLQLWNILQTGSVYLFARQAAELLDLFEQGDMAWLYGHVIACRMLDGWNLQHCSVTSSTGSRSNTIGYHGLDGLVPKTYEDYRIHGIEHRINFTQQQVKLVSDKAE